MRNPFARMKATRIRAMLASFRVWRSVGVRRIPSYPQVQFLHPGGLKRHCARSVGAVLAASGPYFLGERRTAVGGVA
jgi:hypothetical protein